MQNKKKPILPLLIVLAIVIPSAIAGGLFLGSVILIRWLDLKIESSVSLLWRYWHFSGKLPERFEVPLYVSTGAAVFIAIIPIVMLLIGLFMKPKWELHGSARFANDAEIRQTGLLKAKADPKELPDLLIGKHKNQYLRWAGNEFLYLAAPTRSGKGVGVVIPNCLHYRDSMVIYDPKFENFLITGGFRSRHGQDVFLFNPAGCMPEFKNDEHAPEHQPDLLLRSHRWNPMTYIRRNPAFTYADLSQMAAIMLPNSAKDSGSSTFFTESARKLFVGLGLFMIETEHERDLDDYTQRTTFANLFRLTSPTDGRALSEWLKEEIEKRPFLSSQCKTLLLGFANGSPKTGADILASLTAPLGIFLDPVVELATSDDDFRLDEVRIKRMTIFIGIVPTEAAKFSRLTNLFFSQLIDVNVRQGLPQYNPDVLKYQCLLLMDEFTALGYIEMILHGVSYIAGYGLRLLVIIQSPAQVEAIYQRENMRTFFTNFGARIFYTPRDQNDAEEYSKVIGYETFKAKSSSRSSGKGSSRSQSISDQKRAVMNPDELKLMPNTDCVITLGSARAIYAQKIKYYEDEVLQKRANLSPPEVPLLSFNYVQSESKEIVEKVKLEAIPAQELDDTQLQDCENKEQIRLQVLKSLVAPDCSPEYLAKLDSQVSESWNMDTKPLISEIMKEKTAN